MALNLPELPNDASIDSTAASLLWLTATNPTIFTPRSLANGGMSQLAFSSPTEHIVSSYRSTALYKDDGTVHIQDEINMRSANEGTQFNYSFDSEGNLTKYSDRPVSEHMTRVIDALRGLVFQRYSTITGSVQGMGYGSDSSFISNGELWVPTFTSEGTALSQERRAIVEASTARIAIQGS